MTTPSRIRVVIPLKEKRRNGRPRIVPPADLDAADESKPDPRTLRAMHGPGTGAGVWNTVRPRR